MSSLKARWDTHRIGDVVCIVDMGGAVRLIDCIDEIVVNLRIDGAMLGIRRCLCCDVDGMWDEVLLSESQEFLGFAAARSNSLHTALLLVGIQTLSARA